MFAFVVLFGANNTFHFQLVIDIEDIFMITFTTMHFNSIFSFFFFTPFNISNADFFINIIIYKNEYKGYSILLNRQ